ncbi:unnamed protein product, partial [Mycena citricolor]
ALPGREHPNQPPNRASASERTQLPTIGDAQLPDNSALCMDLGCSQIRFDAPPVWKEELQARNDRKGCKPLTEAGLMPQNLTMR